MTDTQKIEKLVDLLGEVMNTLELKQYDIENPHLSHQCEIEADAYHEKMMEILMM